MRFGNSVLLCAVDLLESACKSLCHEQNMPLTWFLTYAGVSVRKFEHAMELLGYTWNVSRCNWVQRNPFAIRSKLDGPASTSAIVICF